MYSRFTILFLSSFILFAFYYVYDIPIALNTRLSTDKSIVDATHLTLLYSAYSLPNIILPLFTVTLFPDPLKLCLVVLAGNIIFLTGVFLNKFVLMLLGRIIFGIGGEGFSVLQNKMMAKYFMGRELALSMGLSAAFARCGTVINYLITPIIAEKYGGQWSCVFGLTLIFFGLFVCVILKKICQDVNKINVKASDDIKTSKPFLVPSKEIMEDGWANFVPEKDSIKELSHDFYDLNVKNEKETENVKEVEKIAAIVEESPAKKTKFFAFQNRSQVFSILVVLSFMYAVIFAPFQSISSLILQKRYRIKNTQAGFLMAIEESISLFVSIFLAVIADFIGYKLLIMLIGSVGLVISFSFLLSNINYLVFIITIGLSGALISCHWPCITYFCTGEDIGRAFAICTCVLNFAYVFAPMIVSLLFTYDKSYDMVCYFLLGVSLLSCFFAMFLWILNSKMKLGLNNASIISI